MGDRHHHLRVPRYTASIAAMISTSMSETRPPGASHPTAADSYARRICCGVTYTTNEPALDGPTGGHA
jgi:hypothetical protein